MICQKALVSSSTSGDLTVVRSGRTRECLFACADEGDRGGFIGNRQKDASDFSQKTEASRINDYRAQPHSTQGGRDSDLCSTHRKDIIMSRMHRFDRLSRHRKIRNKKSPRHDRRLRIEPLEDRRMLATLIVNSAQDNVTSGDGLVTLREAIIAANNDTVTDLGLSGFGADTIRFAVNIGNDPGDDFATPRTILLQLGEFEITEAATVEGPGQELLTINALQQSRIFNITATTGDFTLAGVTLTGGRTVVDSISTVRLGSGGAVRSLTTGNLTIDQSTISGNRTEGYYAEGGGIFTNGSLTITRSTISGNSTMGERAAGGGIYASGTVTLTSSTVSGNYTAGSSALGGGIFSSAPSRSPTAPSAETVRRVVVPAAAGFFPQALSRSPTAPSAEIAAVRPAAEFPPSAAVTLTDSIISGNRSGASGGGISSYGEVALTSSTVSGNSTTGLRAYGGGISSYGEVALTSSTVSGNSTMGELAFGGGIFSTDYVALTSSTVSGNYTTGENADGGGIRSSDGVTLTNSTVSGNSTAGSNAWGGGIRSSGGITLTSSTVTDNHVADSSFGGGILSGIWNSSDRTWTSSDPVTITNSIVAGNTAGGNFSDIVRGPAILTTNFSLLGTAVAPDAGTGNLFDDTPLLGLLANNGGPTQTHALPAGSMAINAGDPNFDVGATPSDQRGAPFVRVFGSRVDMGAYERQTLAPSFFVVTTAADELDYSNAEVSLREAINSANGSFGTDTITFNAALSGDTITLGGTELEIRELLTIDATALGQNVTIDAGGLSRIFSITAAAGDFTLAGLTLTRGLATVTPTFGFNGGGAIRSLTTGNLTLDRSTVSGSRVTIGFARGGGIFSLGGVILIGSTINGNSATGMGGSGGGIHSLRNVTLTSSTVSGNSTTALAAGSGGGGGIFSLGDVLLTSSTVSGNSTTGADDDGGGIRSYGEVTLTSSTVTDNQAFSSSTTGGGIWNYNDTITLNNSIVAGNTAGGGMNDIRPGSGTLEVNFSLIQQTGLTFTGGNNIIGQSANLAPLANNGGPTETHALLATSPAIDAGSPFVGFDPMEYDQRGAPFVRVFDDPGATGTGIDMGAYERQMFSPVVDTISDVVDGDLSAGQFSLREAIELINNNSVAETIIFAAALSGATITLGGTELEIADALTIDATALAQNVTIDANAASRIFNITATTGNFTLAGLTLTGGQTTESFDGGGAIRSNTTDNLTIEQSTISGNSTEGTLSSGGGIYALGTVTLANSTVSGNSTSGITALGGGIFSSGGITLTNSTVSGNSTMGELAFGGGIRSTDYVTLTSSTVTGNSTMGDNADGGGISTFGTVTLSSSTVSKNSTAGGDAEGGGISASAQLRSRAAPLAETAQRAATPTAVGSHLLASSLFFRAQSAETTRRASMPKVVAFRTTTT